MGDRVKSVVPGARRIPLPASALGALRDALFAAGLVLLVAPWVGILWEWVAPAPTYLNLEGSIFLADQDSSDFIAADGWFLIVALVVGLGCGALGYWRFRRRLPHLIAITGSALLGAWIARETGIAFGPPELLAAAAGSSEGEEIRASIDVRSNAVLLAWPVGVLIAYVSLIVGLEKPSRLRAGPDCDAVDSVEADRAPGEFDAGHGGQPGEDESLAGQQRQLRT